ncbi:MAG: hypothetical protein KF857_05925 [Fimbriimonadaceae bacterium]|nr:hypothetical protein [Fimbriimonadaceae bacterium]
MLLLTLAAFALGQSFSTDGSGTLTIAGRHMPVYRVRTEPGGNRIRIIVWTTSDKRFDLVGDSSRDGDSYRVRIDDGLGERGLTGFANIYTRDWTTLKNITASGRFSGGTFDLSFQADNGGGNGHRPNPGNGTGRLGSLNIGRLRYRIDRAEYQTTGNTGRLIFYTEDGKRYDLVGRRRSTGAGDDLDFDDGLGEERVDGSGRVRTDRSGATSASGRGNFRGGSFSFDIRWRSDDGGRDRPELPGFPSSWSGRLRFDNNTRSVTRVEYHPDGNRYRLVIWTTEGKRYDILGTRSSGRGDTDRLTVNDGLGKDRMSGSGSARFRSGNRDRITSVSLSGNYRGGSFTLNIDAR